MSHSAYSRTLKRASSSNLLVCAALSLALVSPAAHAQRAANAQLQAFTHTPFYAGLINRGLAVLPPVVFHKCPALRSAGSQVIELSPVTFAQDGFPITGEWKQRFPVTGCGNDTILNVYFTATTQEKIDTVMGIPGQTRADLRLQQDARRYAVIGATLLAKSCRQFDILNTEIVDVERPDPNRQPTQPPPWSENWNCSQCLANPNT